MNTYQRCHLILRHMSIMASTAFEYQNHWSPEFTLSEIKNRYEALKNSSWFTPINPSLLTKEQMGQLMFNPWEDKEGSIMLIPQYLYQFIEEGVPVMCIDGEAKLFTREGIDNDHRFGCLAYGVIPATEEEK